MSAVALAEELTPAGLDLLFATGDGVTREPLSVCWNVPFERVSPVRAFSSRKGRRGFPGWWWLATTAEHVGFESWLERDHVMMLDFDPEVVAVSSQPFWLAWAAVGGRERRHAPDYFVRLADGTGLVVDVRADDQIGPRDAEAFEVTARACDSVGWQYRRVGALDPVLVANVRWLSGYRHPRCLHLERAAGLREVFATPTALLEGALIVGDPIAVLPVLFHLMWCRVLTADLTAAPLSAATVVWVAGS